MIAQRYLRGESAVSAAIARKRLRPADALERAVWRSREHFFAHAPWPSVPAAVPLIAVADALMVRTEKRVCVIYLILVRPVAANRAVIMQPLIQDGKESWQGWQDAFAALPPDVPRRIRALVCDGHHGLVSAARRHGWLLQRCHFHLIAKLQGRRSRWGASRHRLLGEYLYALVCEILTHPDEAMAYRLRNELEAHRMALGNGKIQSYLSAFFREMTDYRTYLDHPDLSLPRTSNAAEALVAVIRRLLSRAHGFRTRASLMRWVLALLKDRKTIACNGSHQQN